MSGSGHRVVAPGELTTPRPCRVDLINPSYRAEVASQLLELGVAAELLAIEEPTLPTGLKPFRRAILAGFDFPAAAIWR